MNKFIFALILLSFVSCNREKTSKNYSKQKNLNQVYELLMIRDTPTFIVESQNGISVDEYLSENLGYFHIVSHEKFDSINDKLALNLENRNDFNDLSKLDRPSVKAIVEEVGITLTKQIAIEKENTGSYVFKLNRSFWKNTYNGDSYIEFLQDHGAEDLTRFRYFDNYNSCVTTILAIIQRHTSANRVNCENFESNINGSQNANSQIIRSKNKTLDKIFDGTCLNTMFGDEFNELNSSTIKEGIRDLYEKSKENIELYDKYFGSLNEPPYYIIKM